MRMRTSWGKGGVGRRRCRYRTYPIVMIIVSIMIVNIPIIIPRPIVRTSPSRWRFIAGPSVPGRTASSITRPIAYGRRTITPTNHSTDDDDPPPRSPREDRSFRGSAVVLRGRSSCRRRRPPSTARASRTSSSMDLKGIILLVRPIRPPSLPRRVDAFRARSRAGSVMPKGEERGGETMNEVATRTLTTIFMIAKAMGKADRTGRWMNVGSRVICPMRYGVRRIRVVHLGGRIHRVKSTMSAVRHPLEADAVIRLPRGEMSTLPTAAPPSEARSSFLPPNGITSPSRRLRRVRIPRATWTVPSSTAPPFPPCRTIKIDPKIPRVSIMRTRDDSILMSENRSDRRTFRTRCLRRRAVTRIVILNGGACWWNRILNASRNIRNTSRSTGMRGVNPVPAPAG